MFRGGIPHPQQLEFRRLEMWKQIGLGGLLDCNGPYFIVNLSILLLSFCSFFIFIIMLNSNGEFKTDYWGGNFTDESFIPCEDIDVGSFVKQKINAGTSYFYIASGIFILTLGLYDRTSWQERDALWRETHLIGKNDRRKSSFAGNATQATQGRRASGAQPAQPSQTTGRSETRRSAGRNGVNPVRNPGAAMNRTGRSRQSMASSMTVQTSKTTFSIEHEEITYRRRFHEYIMGKRGSPSLIIRQPLWSYIFAGSLIFIGFTGFLFHASITATAKRLDDFALWVIIIDLCAYSWSRYASDGATWKFICIDCTRYQDNPRRSSLFSTLFFVAIGACFDFLMLFSVDHLREGDYQRAALIGALVVFSIPMFLHWNTKGNEIGSAWTLIILSICCMTAGYLFNEFDIEGEALCFPGSGFQPHALWHFFSSLGVIFLLLLFRSDFFLYDTPIDGENSPRLLTDLKEDPNLFAMQNPLNGSGPLEPNTNIAIRPVTSRGSEALIEEDGSISSSTLKGSSLKNVRKRQQGGAFHSQINLDENNGAEESSDFIEMWSCDACDFKDNSMKVDLVCRNCGKDRPSIDQFVAIPFGKSNANNTISSSSQASQSRTRNSHTRTLRSRRPNSAGRTIPRVSLRNGQRTNPRISNSRVPATVTRVSNNRTGNINTVSSQGSRASRGSGARQSATRQSRPSLEKTLNINLDLDAAIERTTRNSRTRRSRERNNDNVRRINTSFSEEPVGDSEDDVPI